jgi:hypothetical protein
VRNNKIDRRDEQNKDWNHRSWRLTGTQQKEKEKERVKGN